MASSSSSTLRSSRDDVLEEQFGLVLEALAQVLVKLGEDVRIRLLLLQIANVEPLPGEIRDQRVGARVVEHAAHLRLQHGGIPQLALFGQVQQLGRPGTLLHRKKESRDASSRSLMRYTVAGAAPGGSCSMRKRKSGETSSARSAFSMP